MHQLTPILEHTPLHSEGEERGRREREKREGEERGREKMSIHKALSDIHQCYWPSKAENTNTNTNRG